MFFHFYILTSRVYFVNNWTVDVSSTSYNIDKIGLREKNKNKEQTQKTTLKKGSNKRRREAYIMKNVK